VDFGLVQRQGATAVVAGTPAYMAPELFDGATPDPRSDQFAFAVSLFEAFASERPFTARSVVALQLCMRAGVSFEAWRAVPGWVRPVLRRALDAKPHRRFSSMAALEAELLRDYAERFHGATGGVR
jgi:serine/threonine protein kinase